MADPKLIEVEGEIVEFPSDMSDAEIAQILSKQYPSSTKPAVSTTAPTSGFMMGLKDPISGGAQLLEKVLPQQAVDAINQANAWLADRGLVAPLPAGGVGEMVKQEQQTYEAQRAARGEEGFDWARLGGNVLNPANLAAGYRGAQLFSKASPMAQAIAGGAAGAALQPVVSDEPFAQAKAKQVAGGGVAGVAGAAITKAAGKVLNPLVTQAEQTMRDLGVTLTPGQMLGAQGKKLEEFAENIPLIGQYIGNAKERQLFQFNKGVINKALSKVDTELPADVIGRDAVRAANDIIDEKYTSVLSKIKFTSNRDVQSALDQVIRTSKLSGAAEKQKLNDLINDYIFSKIPVNNKNVGEISGEAYKGIESDMLKKIQSLRSSSTDAERSLGEEFGRVLDVMKKFLRAQNPTESSNLRRIDSAYGDLSVMRTAAANSGAINGVFTPKQYQTAVRQRDLTRSKSAFAAGKARGQDVSEAAVEILQPDPGSTLEGRLALGLGGGYGAITNPQVAAAVAVSTPALYSEAGLRAIEAIMRTRPEIAKRIGKVLTDRATKEGSISSAQVLEEYRRATRTK